MGKGGRLIEGLRVMRTMASILLGVTIIWGGASAMTIKMDQGEYREKFAAQPGSVLKVYNRNGEIRISGWERDYIEIVAIKNQGLLNHFLKAPEIEVQNGKDFVIRTHYNSALCEAVWVQYQITVPQGVRVAHVETSTGEVHIQGVKGPVQAVTSTGSIRVERVNGDVEAKTSTGGIEVYKVTGMVKALSSTGEIKIAEIGCLAGANTETGKVSVEVPAFREDLVISSSYGSVTVAFAPEIAANLEASTSNGQITYTDLPLTVSRSLKTRLTGRLGTGGGNIEIKTASGSITLRKL